MRFQSAYQAYQAGRFDEAERDISAHLRQSPTEAQAQQLGALIAMRRFDVRGAWSVRLGSGRHHVNQIHSRGWIRFGGLPAPLNAILGQGPEHEVKPIPGRLVLFPSYLWHGTYPITGDATRMTLPIDILPARPK